MTVNLDAKGAAEFLSARDDILIFTHKSADGDTCGSAAALCLALRRAGKRAFVHKNTKSTPRFESMMKGFEPDDGFEAKTLVTVDMADKNRFYPESEQYADKIELGIDHHISNSGYAERTFVNPGAAACGELIAEICDAMNIEIDGEIAKMIYIAVSTDTGCFKYSNTTANTLRVAARCYDAGFDAAAVNKAFFDTKTKAQVRLETYVYEHIRYFSDGRLAVIVLPLEVKSTLGASETDLEGLSSLPVQISGVELALTLKQTDEGKMKMSARSSGKVNAYKFCRMFGGGGHAAAAGALTDNFSDEQVENVIKKAEEYLADV